MLGWPSRTPLNCSILPIYRLSFNLLWSVICTSSHSCCIGGIEGLFGLEFWGLGNKFKGGVYLSVDLLIGYLRQGISILSSLSLCIVSSTCFLSWSVVLSSPGIVSLMQILAGSVQGVTQRHSEEIQGWRHEDKWISWAVQHWDIEQVHSNGCLSGWDGDWTDIGVFGSDGSDWIGDWYSVGSVDYIWVLLEVGEGEEELPEGGGVMIVFLSKIMKNHHYNNNTKVLSVKGKTMKSIKINK